MRSKPLVGVWVDHRRALMLWADEQGNMEVEEIESEYQEEGEPSDNVGLGATNGGGGAVPHANLEARRREQLKHYYKKLDQALRSAREVYLFGPGQAKKELANYVQNDKGFRARLKGVEAADKKMTRAQMAARVREFFQLPRNSV